MSPWDDYTVAWICALVDQELPAALCMLDQRYDVRTQPIQDENTYYYGAINGHKVVIACMTPARAGITSAATLAQTLKWSFKKIQVCLFVGIAGGIPYFPSKTEEDVFLGDVVVGWPKRAGQPPVVQYDVGRITHLNALPPETEAPLVKLPSDRVLGVLTRFLGEYNDGRVDFDKHLRRLDRIPNSGFPGRGTDKLYQADIHCESAEDHHETLCRCNEEHLVNRSRQYSRQKALHFHRGSILSGERFMMSSQVREQLRSRYPEARCVEMEGGGVMRAIEALVIRGICDYADSHVNRKWQKYAAGTAAAFARELLFWLPHADGVLPQELDKFYTFESIAFHEEKYLARRENVWEKMTVAGLSLYEQIYRACVNRRGRVHVDDLQKYFPPDATDSFDEACRVLSIEPASLIHHGMTLALIYVVHLHYYCDESLRKLQRALQPGSKYNPPNLNQFGKWTSCNCQDQQCPSLWNFINRTGLCRNPVSTCHVQRFIENSATGKDNGVIMYNLKDYLELKLRWNEQ